MNNRVPRLRIDRGWSQVKLASKLGVSRQTISSIENGKYDPSLPLAFRIAHLFGVQIEDVFTPPAGAEEEELPFAPV
ncbi:MAG: helix-turn-helix transcriptional regulator [Acidimicrobiia bacterium]